MTYLLHALRSRLEDIREEGLPVRLLECISYALDGLDVVRHDGVVILHRFRIFDHPRLGIYLHKLMSRDQEPGVFHDHPWRWNLSFILTGWYLEERPEFNKAIFTRRLIPWDLNVIAEDTFHRLLAVSEGGCWTIYIRGGRTREDGFLILTQGDVQYEPACESKREQKVPMASRLARLRQAIGL